MTETEQSKYTIRVEKTITVVASNEKQAVTEAENAFGLSPSHFEIEEKTPVKPISGPAIKARFHPQRWSGDYARKADSKGKEEWWMPLEDALTDDGILPDDRSYESDGLRYHDRAPLWIKQWDGPFYVTIQEIQDLPEDESPTDYTRD
ncbi:hypothetical protein [Salinibaculum rarum]|uniref:hypothetical protein n=1 Tax=Salinibaculum rarum TaxID=3058903 RepID=UPI0026604CC5|nr:hypothetical protein [Salinibaculum sp. KK48]